MVKAVCRFNEEKVKNMSRRMRNSTLFGSIMFAVFILIIGGYNIYASFSNEGVTKWVFFVLGILISLFSVYPIISTLINNKRNYKDTIVAMELDKGELVLEFTIKEKKIELKAIQNGEEQNDTILIRNLSLIKTHADGVGIYLGENMYYIRDDEIVIGDRDMLIRIFKNAGIQIKKR